MENFFDNRRILNSLWKWKYHLAIVTILAIVLGALISSPMIMQPKFKSTARLYPANLYVFSDESETEQMLEVIRSNDIKFRIIDAFNLDLVYGIPKSDPNYLANMFFEYNKNIDAKKTEFETVEIKVTDTDPQRASDIADSIIAFYHEKYEEMHKIKYLELARITKRDLVLKNAEIDSVSYLLDSIRAKNKILGFQNDKIVGAYMDALSKSGNSRAVEGSMDRMIKEGSKVYRLERQLSSYISTADSLKREYDFGISQGTKDITYVLVVKNHFPSVKNFYPVRWIIVFLCAFIALFVVMITVIVLDFTRAS